MEKKELKFYETPAVEVVEMGVHTPLLAVSDQIEGPTGSEGQDF